MREIPLPQRPDRLLLDEPTNHLDAESTNIRNKLTELYGN